MKLLHKIPKPILINVLTAFCVSLIASFITYKIIDYRIPKIATVDLSYLNNEFMVNLSRHLIENKISDKKIEQAVKTHLETLDSILNDINHSNRNFILLQKQIVVSEDVEDITKKIEQVIFNNIVMNNKNEVGDENK